MSFRRAVRAFRHVESFAPFCSCEYPAPTRLGECWTCRKLVVTDELRARVAAHKAQKEDE